MAYKYHDSVQRRPERPEPHAQRQMVCQRIADDGGKHEGADT
jgi:hypothetical protein